MRRSLSLSPLVAAIALLTISLPVDAATGNCSGTITPIPIASNLKFYVDNRGVNDGIWIYQETNTHAGLQRGGTSLLNEQDTCTDDPNLTPDMLIL